MRHQHTSEKAQVKPKLTVTAAAKILGVTRVHLSYVKHGHRSSPRLLRRYNALRHQHTTVTA